MINDPISDFLTRIKNGYLSRKEKVSVPYSLLKGKLANLLVREGYLGEIEIKKESNVKKSILMSLLYKEKKPVLTDIIRVSKPGRKVYMPKEKLPKVLGGLGIAIISTSAGLMTDKQARKKGIGGEIICKIW